MRQTSTSNAYRLIERRIIWDSVVAIDISDMQPQIVEMFSLAFDAYLNINQDFGIFDIGM